MKSKPHQWYPHLQELLEINRRFSTLELSLCLRSIMCLQFVFYWYVIPKPFCMFGGLMMLEHGQHGMSAKLNSSSTCPVKIRANASLISSERLTADHPRLKRQVYVDANHLKWNSSVAQCLHLLPLCDTEVVWPIWPVNDYTTASKTPSVDIFVVSHSCLI